MTRFIQIFFFSSIVLSTTWAKETNKQPLQKANSTSSSQPAVTEDTGKEQIGKVKASLYIGFNGDISKLGSKAKGLKPPKQSTIKLLQAVDKLRFDHYLNLGEDVQSVFRSYENWLSPLKPSEEILLSYDSQGRLDNGGLRLDLELWQHHHKVMKTNPVLLKNKPLFILGPKWRGGTLIIAVELLELTDKAPKAHS